MFPEDEVQAENKYLIMSDDLFCLHRQDQGHRQLLRSAGGGGLASRIEFGAYNESRIHYIWTLLSFDFCMYNTAYNLLLR